MSFFHMIDMRINVDASLKRAYVGVRCGRIELELTKNGERTSEEVPTHANNKSSKTTRNRTTKRRKLGMATRTRTTTRLGKTRRKEIIKTQKWNEMMSPERSLGSER